MAEDMKNVMNDETVEKDAVSEETTENAATENDAVSNETSENETSQNEEAENEEAENEEVESADGDENAEKPKKESFFNELSFMSCSRQGATAPPYSGSHRSP